MIGDFAHGTDHIQLTGLGFASFAAVQNSMHEVSGTTAIDLSNGDFIVVNGLAAATFTSGDFILG